MALASVASVASALKVRRFDLMRRGVGDIRASLNSGRPIRKALRRFR